MDIAILAYAGVGLLVADGYGRTIRHENALVRSAALAAAVIVWPIAAIIVTIAVMDDL